MALKIIYNEQDTDFVFTVSPGKLYAKCKKQKIPFVNVKATDDKLDLSISPMKEKLSKKEKM